MKVLRGILHLPLLGGERFKQKNELGLSRESFKWETPQEKKKDKGVAVRRG